ncbi:MAG: hypothetical protein AAGC54_18080, partial [Cyanobacteria bacterium P01_F01_bin.4]
MVTALSPGRLPAFQSLSHFSIPRKNYSLSITAALRPVSTVNANKEWAERDSNSHNRSRHILSVVRL